MKFHNKKSKISVVDYTTGSGKEEPLHAKPPSLNQQKSPTSLGDNGFPPKEPDELQLRGGVFVGGIEKNWAEVPELRCGGLMVISSQNDTWHGKAWRGVARHGWAGRGKAWQGKELIVI